MNIEEKRNLIVQEINNIQENDIKEILDKLQLSVKEAKEIIEVIHHRDSNCMVEYQIINMNTLEVYKHRKIDINLNGSFGMSGGF